MKNTYKFTALCKSGAQQYFVFEATNYIEARRMLSELIESN